MGLKLFYLIIFLKLELLFCPDPKTQLSHQFIWIHIFFSFAIFSVLLSWEMAIFVISVVLVSCL